MPSGCYPALTPNMIWTVGRGTWTRALFTNSGHSGRTKGLMDAHQLALTEPWPSYPHFPPVEVEVMQLLHDSQVQRVLDMKAKKK